MLGIRISRRHRHHQMLNMALVASLPISMLQMVVVMVVVVVVMVEKEEHHQDKKQQVCCGYAAPL